MPTAVAPPVTAAGKTESDTIIGLTFNITVLLVLPAAALMTTSVDDEIELTVKPNEADFAPARTLMLVGNDTYPLGVADNDTTWPPVGAATDNVTVPRT